MEKLNIRISMLFSLHMNNLPDIITNCSVEYYDDDTKLFISFATNENEKVDAQVRLSPISIV